MFHFTSSGMHVDKVQKISVTMHNYEYRKPALSAGENNLGELLCQKSYVIQFDGEICTLHYTKTPSRQDKYCLKNHVLAKGTSRLVPDY